MFIITKLYSTIINDLKIYSFITSLYFEIKKPKSLFKR